MKSRLLRFISMALLPALFMAWVCGCAKHRHQDGGQDGGGGHVQLSSDDQVTHTIDLVLRLASVDDYRQNIFVPFFFYQNANFFSEFLKDHKITEAQKAFDPQNQGAQHELYEKVARIFIDSPATKCLLSSGLELYPDCAFVKDGEYNFAAFTAILRRAITASSLRLEFHNDCGHDVDNHADASVSAFREGAELCFSVRNLRRIPPSGLKREISGLVFHELAHLRGFDEQDAQILQARFLEFYDATYGPLTAELIQSETRRRLDLVENYLSLRSLISSSTLSFATVTLQDLPGLAIPAAYGLMLEPTNGVSAFNYSYSVMKLYAHSLLLSSVTDQTEFKRQFDRSSNLLGDELDIVKQNWNVLNGNGNGGTLTCKSAPGISLSIYLTLVRKSYPSKYVDLIFSGPTPKECQ